VFAEILVNLPVEGTFHYHIPAQLAGRLQIGHLVRVTFGHQKAQGIVLGFDLRAPVPDTRPVEGLVDRDPVIGKAQLALARWMSDTYLASLADCVRLFIPPGLSRRGDTQITTLIDPDLIEPRDDTQKRLLSLLKRRGPLRGRQIARSLPRRDWRGAAADLVERGLALRDPVLDPPAIGAKQVRVVELGIAPEQVEICISQVLGLENIPSNRRAAIGRRAAILRTLAGRREPMTTGEVYAAVEGSSTRDLQVLAEDDLVVLREEEVWRDPLAGKTFVPEVPPALTPHQAAAWAIIQQELASGSPHPVLLHGVTGSGKTELYLRAAAHVIEQGRGAIILVPEIALTPQTIRRVGSRFPGRLGLIHSALPAGERYDTWRRTRNGQIDVVVGPRSALFAPIADLGLIVMDECHDDSYKQTPPIPPPYYHALHTAVEMARLHGALFIAGSATPNVTTYAHARPPGSDEPADLWLIELPARIMGHREAIRTQAVHFHIDAPRYAHQMGDPEEAVMIDLPPVQVADMRQELRAGNRSIFSRALVSAMKETLERGEQSILFLNRRGTSTYIFCRECGYAMVCPRCETPLTWHSYRDPGRAGEGMLVCHHCDYRGEHPDRCPACGSSQIKFFGGGTERVEEEVERRFPSARVLRWDRDTTGGKGVHDALLDRFIRQEADVLIGTQMVAKGLDLPLVTLVGVVNADTALYLPDYRSGERTFQLLTQVAGRAGRGLLGGQVILQTYTPEHYAIQAASRHDYHGFYGREMRYRSELGYPPFSRLARLEIRTTTAQRARAIGERLHTLLLQRIAEEKLVQTSLIGPTPCFYPRRDNLHRWQILVRGPNPAAALRNLHPSPEVIVDVDPVSLL
jgi:primosomal protein N' (replication factor Y)